MNSQRIITLTPEIKPVIEHIQDLQIEIKSLEAELKQYKTLLQNDYMTNVDKIETAQGVVVASIVESSSKSLDEKRFALETPSAYETYKSFIIRKIYSYLKVK